MPQADLDLLLLFVITWKITNIDTIHTIIHYFNRECEVVMVVVRWEVS